MKESLRRFYDYLDSDEELTYSVRMNAEWNEEAFCKMKKLVKAVMEDYAKEECYPKRFAGYFVREIPSVINMLSHIKVCTEENILKGYTQESYMDMLAEKRKQLEELKWEFEKSLFH
jgi:hypothetical protein